MPIRLHVDDARKFGLIRGWGVTDRADHFAGFEKYVQAVGGKPDGWTLIVDLLDVEAVERDVDFDALRFTGQRNASLLQGLEVRSAFLVDSDLTLGLVRMFNALSNRDEGVFHCKTLREALEELDVPEAWVPDWAWENR